MRTRPGTTMLAMLACLLPGAGGWAAPSAGMAGAAAASAWQAEPLEPAQAVRPTDDEWREDIEFVAGHLIENHVDPFHTISERAFRDSVDALVASVGRATDAELVAGLSRLVASIGDAHTYLRFPTDGPLASHVYPIRFEWLDEGLIIGSAVPEHARLIGARVETLDGTPAQEALRVASDYMYRENDWTARIAAPRVLARAEVGAAIGVAASPDSMTLAVTLPDGTDETIVIRPLPAGPAEWVAPHEARGIPAPLHLRHRDRNFWIERLDDRDAWYVQFNAARDAEDETIAQFAGRLADSLVARPAGDVILDVRWNVGGNSAATVPLVRTLVAQRERAPETGFFVVIGPRSLSATIVVLGDLTRMLDPILVGEPTGARPNLYGENPFTEETPNTGLAFTWATQYFQPFGPGAHPEAVLPAIAASPTAEDLLAGRDPALRAIADYAPYDLPGALRTAYETDGIEAAIDVYESFRADPRNAHRRPFDIVRRFGNDVGATSLEDALTIFRLLHRDYPDRARTYEVLGSVFEGLGRMDEARSHYREGLRRLAGDETVSRPLAYALRRWMRGRLDGLGRP